MSGFGTQFSTTEGWGALLLTALTVIKSLGWLGDTDATQLTLTIGQTVVGIVAIIAFLKKTFRKGSTPFVADPVAPKPAAPPAP